jgi:hypothetical protein
MLLAVSLHEIPVFTLTARFKIAPSNFIGGGWVLQTYGSIGHRNSL